MKQNNTVHNVSTSYIWTVLFYEIQICFMGLACDSDGVWLVCGGEFLYAAEPGGKNGAAACGREFRQ